MSSIKDEHLILGVTGASGTYAAKILIEKSLWPVDIIISDWGKSVMKYEHIDINSFLDKVAFQFQNDDLFALPSSGSILTAGMVILPCSSKTLGEIACGIGKSLITRAAHCHLKERRPLILCLRETPLSSIDIKNMKQVSDAGGIVMPLSPPFYMFTEYSPYDVSMIDIFNAFVDRVLSLLGQRALSTWENVK